MRSPNDIEVSLGVHFPELRPTLVSAVSGYTIRNYNLETKEEDIALVQLRKTITFTDTVMPVCLPQSNDPVPTNARCYISGWGKTIISGDLSPTLRVVDVKILGNSNCEVHEKAKPKSFCAGHKEGGKDACQGDSGGPLMCFVNNHFVLYGITSHGTGCGFPGKAGVYSEVAKYMDWIREQSTSYGIAFDPYTE
ncbi:trypsin [Trichuris suis]|nr:trypsin [Trichuris suis]